MANLDAQAQIAALREEIDKLKEDLVTRTAGAYGNMRDKAEKAGKAVRVAAQDRADYLRAEGAAVAEAAREHPAAVSTLVLTAGLAGFAVGYLLASAAEPPRSRYWR